MVQWWKGSIGFRILLWPLQYHEWSWSKYYHVGLNFMFDIGIQHCTLKTNKGINRHNYVIDMTEIGVILQNTTGKFQKTKNLVGCIIKQKGDIPWQYSKWYYNSHQSFIRHYWDEKNHVLFNIWFWSAHLETIYQEECEGLLRHKVDESMKKGYLVREQI